MAIKGPMKQQSQELEVPDVNYRALKALNYSMIVEFEKSPASFVQQFILGQEKEDDEDTSATILGNVIDDLLLTYKGDFDAFDSNFDKTYALYTGVDVGTKQVFILADELFRLTKKHPDETFAQRMAWAFDSVQKKGKYKGKKLEVAMQDFDDNATGYFQVKIDNIGKIVVSEGLLEKGKKIASLTLNDDFTKKIYDFSNEHDEEYIKMAKVPITFKYQNDDGEMEGKCEVDHMDIDYKNKMIFPMDTKSTYDNTLFPYNYRKNRYYIQNAWYSKGIRHWAHENGMDGFTIAPYQFIVTDTSYARRRPLIYNTSVEMLRKAENGWEQDGRWWKGMLELVNDIIWSNEKGEWGVSKAAFLNNGIINL